MAVQIVTLHEKLEEKNVFIRINLQWGNSLQSLKVSLYINLSHIKRLSILYGKRPHMVDLKYMYFLPSLGYKNTGNM